MRRLGSWLAAAFLLLGLVGMVQPGSAQTQPQPQAEAPGALPQGFTQKQFDDLVEAISRSVAKKLKEDGTTSAKAAPAASAAAPAKAEEPAEEGGAAAGFALFLDRIEADVMAAPGFVAAYADMPHALDRSHEGGPGLFVYLLMLAVSAAAVLAVERVVDIGTSGLRGRLIRSAPPETGWRSLLSVAGLALLDAAGLAAMWLMTNALTGLWFSGQDSQSKLAFAVLSGIFSWRLYMFAFRVVLRPKTPEARLAPMSDAEADGVYRRISTVVIAIVAVRIILRIAIALKAPRESVAFGQILVNIGLLWAFLWACFSSRHAVASWFQSLATQSVVGRAVGRNWLTIAIPFFCAMVAAQIFGAVMARFAIPAAMLLTLNTVLGWIMVLTLVNAIKARLAPTSEGAGTPMSLMDLAARCFNVALFIGAALIVAQTWIVDVFALVDANGWRALTRSSVAAGMAMFLAYVGIELVRFFTSRYAEPAAAPGGAPPEEDEHVTTASRLATLMPLTRIALTIVIVVTALLIVLSEWGVNITPLIAGASVFGLALSFGSQTLVRDIVSGIFYLADDAFRVGEYIDCGKAKGTVEGFTLRSIRLRHQSGQVHTIPFGQLGQVTNFSRDWSTVKFNLRFARATDVEKLRKTVKKIGQEMAEDPELKNEFLEPLKMQGLADITDNALIIRFKFTVRPGKPSFIQREAVKRMVRVFPSQGIEFANALVSVQTFGGGVENNSAAAAAQSALQRIQAEAAATMS